MILKMVIDISMLSLCKFSVNITINIKLWELLLKKKKKIEHLEQKDLTNYKWFSSKGRRKKVVVLGDGGWWGGGFFTFESFIYLFYLMIMIEAAFMPKSWQNITFMDYLNFIKVWINELIANRNK